MAPRSAAAVTSGLLLLTAARAAPSELPTVDGLDAGEVRAALVAALMSAYAPPDAALIRSVTRAEVAGVAAARSGCGDVLLGCCWLLFMLGDLADSALVWEAKGIDFDTYCYVDSILLVPHGVEATAAWARSHGHHDLADYVEQPWAKDVAEGIADWRRAEFFGPIPAATASVQELAAWIRQ